MQFNVFLTLYVLTVPVFVLLDMVWLGVLARNFYQTRLEHVLGDAQWIAAGAFYLIFALGLTLFATYPTALHGTAVSGAILGALFGFFCYATYDLTNQATLREWPLSVTLVDLCWGTIIGGVTASCVTALYTTLFS